MQIAVVLTPPTDLHFRWAAQVGADEFVARYPMVGTFDDMDRLRDRAGGFGLRLGAVEGYLPIDDIIHGRADRDQQIEEMKSLIRNMGRLEVPILCYNFMPNSDWTRTSFNEEERGGAQVNGFDTILLKAESMPLEKRTAAGLWSNLEYFLHAVLPVAEAAGVQLAMHPDDPPLPVLQGSEQIMHDEASFDRLFELSDSPANKMCFCQGTFAEMGVDIPAAIGRFADKIAYVHFRDVRGNLKDGSRFVESFHDNGDTDMAAAMRAYHEAGFRGAMRPDHVPKLEGEEGIADGYSMLGRLFAVGYMRGLMHAIVGKR